MKQNNINYLHFPKTLEYSLLVIHKSCAKSQNNFVENYNLKRVILVLNLPHSSILCILSSKTLLAFQI